MLHAPASYCRQSPWRFSIGQTLAELDTALLSARLRERSIDLTAGALDRALPAAWRRYDAWTAPSSSKRYVRIPKPFQNDAMVPTA